MNQYRNSYYESIIKFIELPNFSQVYSSTESGESLSKALSQFQTFKLFAGILSLMDFDLKVFQTLSNRLNSSSILGRLFEHPEDRLADR